MDIQDLIFKSVETDVVVAELRAEREGVLSGIDDALAAAGEIGLTILSSLPEGAPILPEDVVLKVQGTPKQMVVAEDRLIGLVAKPSGIATAAAAFVKAADNSFRIVCGSWKKVDSKMKPSFRRAVTTGGCRVRLLSEPMVYLDKNYLVMMGGIQDTLERIAEEPELQGRKKVVQVKGRDKDLALEIWSAAEFGADVIYLDTGKFDAFDALAEAQSYMSRAPLIAFGGNVTLADVERLKSYPVDIVGVGKAIIDAPMVDMRFDVITQKRHQCDCAAHRAAGNDGQEERKQNG